MKIYNNPLINKQLNTLIDKVPKFYKPALSFIALQEAESGLSHIRFIQDTVTNWVPKATFSRSKADFSEMTFLELSESVLVYYIPALLGEKVFRKIFSKKLPENLKSLVSNSAKDLLNNKNLTQGNLKSLMSVKAAIALGCIFVPIAEYSLNYVKNLFTLKLFKQADFNNIANLNKIKSEDAGRQEKVKKSAVKHIKFASAAYLTCLGASILLALRGNKSKLLQGLSELILTPGTKLFAKNTKLSGFFNKYFSLDFADHLGKLVLGRGQLTACVLIGAGGYLGAAKDRGKQNFLEVLSRYPIVGFFVITGSELFEKGFKKYLLNKGRFGNLINEKLEVPKLNKLPEIAKKLAKENGTGVEKEFHELLRGKVLISGIPFLFSLGFLGFFIAGMTRFWTAYRYKSESKEALKDANSRMQNKNIDKRVFHNFLRNV